jgi:hypothetical protein
MVLYEDLILFSTSSQIGTLGGSLQVLMYSLVLNLRQGTEQSEPATPRGQF